MGVIGEKEENEEPKINKKTFCSDGFVPWSGSNEIDIDDDMENIISNKEEKIIKSQENICDLDFGNM